MHLSMKADSSRSSGSLRNTHRMNQGLSDHFHWHSASSWTCTYHHVGHLYQQEDLWLVTELRENLQQHTLYQTAAHLTWHGMEIVMLEEMILGRKSLPWRVRYRNQDGLIISFLFWLWYRSWTTTYAIHWNTCGKQIDGPRWLNK